MSYSKFVSYTFPLLFLYLVFHSISCSWRFFLFCSVCQTVWIITTEQTNVVVSLVHKSAAVLYRHFVDTSLLALLIVPIAHSSSVQFNSIQFNWLVCSILLTLAGVLN